MMGRWNRWGSFGALAAVIGVATAACSSSSSGGYLESAGGVSATGSSSGGGGPTQPMLAVLDTNQTMSAAPGQGVGVFVQYQAGGHWDVWWTCDTDKTGLTCDYDVVASVESGSIANLAGPSLAAGDAVSQEGDQRVEAATTTSVGVDGMTFDTPLGNSAPIVTVNVSLNGTQSGSFFFFVQDGKINGDYQGMLTDPLEFQPSAP